MRHAQNNDVYESTTQCATDWSSINWYKVEKYVDKLQKRIYHAESIMTELSDKVLLEPYVWKRTRTVLKRVRTSNRPILSNVRQARVYFPFKSVKFYFNPRYDGIFPIETHN